jgi:acyl carrier protein
MNNKTEDRIKNVMSVVFDIPIGQINKDSSPDNIGSWDSLKHMNLVVALEEEYNIEFADDEILEMMNYSLIRNIIGEKI